MKFTRYLQSYLYGRCFTYTELLFIIFENLHSFIADQFFLICQCFLICQRFLIHSLKFLIILSSSVYLIDLIYNMIYHSFPKMLKMFVNQSKYLILSASENFQNDKMLLCSFCVNFICIFIYFYFFFLALIVFPHLLIGSKNFL